MPPMLHQSAFLAVDRLKAKIYNNTTGVRPDCATPIGYLTFGFVCGSSERLNVMGRVRYAMPGE